MSMKVVLSNPIESRCTWCDKDRETVLTSFSDRFLVDAPLCWKCLQTAMKVRTKQTSPDEPDATKPNARQAEVTAKE